MDLVGQQTSEREDMEEALVVDNEGAQRPNAEKDGRNGGHDEGFVARYTHVPEGEIYRNQYAWLGEEIQTLTYTR